MSDGMISVIALCGRQGAGKTTAALHLLHRGYFRIRFANALKKMLRDGLGISDEYIDGPKKEFPCPELCGRTARHAMITLGTEWGRRKIHRDIWVHSLFREMRKLINEGYDKFVIDDLRFLTEEKWLRSLKVGSDIPIMVKIIKLERDGVIISDHQSEREIDKIIPDWCIYNNDSVKSLQDSIDDILQRTQGGI